MYSPFFVYTLFIPKYSQSVSTLNSALSVIVEAQAHPFPLCTKCLLEKHKKALTDAVARAISPTSPLPQTPQPSPSISPASISPSAPAQSPPQSPPAVSLSDKEDPKLRSLGAKAKSVRPVIYSSFNTFREIYNL